MKRNVILEAQVLKAIEVRGEATESEIISDIKEQFGVEIDDYEFMRVIRGWLAKKSITVSKIRGENAYHLRDAPPSFTSLQVYQLKGLTGNDAEKIIRSLETHYDSLKAYVSREPNYKDYHLLECQFVTLDSVAGGDTGHEDRLLVFPRKDGKPYIRRNWMRGLFRDNSNTVNIVASFMANFVGFSDSEPLDVEVKQIDNVKVKEGLCSYEIIPAGTKFTVMIRFPFSGSKIKSLDNFKEFCKIFESAPIKGLGAYSNYFGGRIRLLSVNELN